MWRDPIPIFVQNGQVTWKVQAELLYAVRWSVAEPNCKKLTLAREFCKERRHRIQL